MAKLTQFGRMRRRIKRELEEARRKNVWASAQSAMIIANSYAHAKLVTETTVTLKMFQAWKKKRLGHLPDPPEPEYTAEPILTPGQKGFKEMGEAAEKAAKQLLKP